MLPALFQLEVIYFFLSIPKFADSYIIFEHSTLACSVLYD